MSDYRDLAVLVFCVFGMAFVIGLEWPQQTACAEALEDGRRLIVQTVSGKETRCRYERLSRVQ